MSNQQGAADSSATTALAGVHVFSAPCVGEAQHPPSALFPSFNSRLGEVGTLQQHLNMCLDFAMS